MAQTKTDFFNPPEIIIKEEESGAITVEGWADDIKTHEHSIKALVKKMHKKHYKPLRKFRYASSLTKCTTNKYSS